MSKKQAPQPVKAAEPPKKAGFDPKAYCKNGVTEDAVVAAKTAFDLFDTDQGGSVDIKGTPSII